MRRPRASMTHRNAPTSDPVAAKCEPSFLPDATPAHRRTARQWQHVGAAPSSRRWRDASIACDASSTSAAAEAPAAAAKRRSDRASAATTTSPAKSIASGPVDATRSLLATQLQCRARSRGDGADDDEADEEEPAAAAAAPVPTRQSSSRLAQHTASSASLPKASPVTRAPMDRKSSSAHSSIRGGNLASSAELALLSSSADASSLPSASLPPSLRSGEHGSFWSDCSHSSTASVSFSMP